MLAAHHHDVPEDLLEQARGLAAVRGRAGEQAAQEPARAINADKPDEPKPGRRLSRLGGHPSQELGAERSLDFLAIPAGVVHFVGDLGPDVFPQRAPPGRGERLDLHLALTVPDCYPGTVLVGHDELDLVLRAHRHQQAAEVDPVPIGDGLPGVPRAALGPRILRRPFTPGRLIVGLVIQLIIGQSLTAFGLAGPVPAILC